MYLTEQEIMGTQEALMRSYEQIESQEQEIKRFFEENKSRKFVFIGCGSSNMLAKSCERLFIARPGTSAVALAGGDYLVIEGSLPEPPKELAQILTKELGRKPIQISTAGASIAINAGPKLLGVGFLGQRRR